MSVVRFVNFSPWQGLELSISDIFPTTDQFCCHFAVSFSCPDSNFTFGAKVYERVPFWDKSWNLYWGKLHNKAYATGESRLQYKRP